MGSLSLQCPFCCEEKFSSHHSLKYHILSLIDNLLCPACNCRFDKILDLADHLDRECKDKETEPEECSSDHRHLFSKIKQEVPETPMSNIIESEDNTHNESVGDDQNSILARALLGETSDSQKTEFDPPSYLCQTCNINFESIEEHLQQYHDGEEVILETDENVDVQTDENVDVQTDELIDESEDEGAQYVLQVADNIDTYTKGDQTIGEEQCVDKDGRAYTRKIVKINNFWMEKTITTPLTENYVLENGKVRRVSDDDEEDSNLEKEGILKIHQCPKCYLQFPKLDHYMKHICDPTKVKNKYKCIYCTSVYHNYQSLNAHMKAHLIKDKDGQLKRIITVGPHTCNICKTMFPSFKSLRLHERMHEPVKDKTPEAPVNYSITGAVDDSKDMIRNMFMCSICNNTYDKEYEEVHMKSHSKEENFDCKICNRKFYTKENLEMHAKAHSNPKKFACSYCKKPFTTYEALQEHVTNQCQKRQYECQYCGRRFSRPHEKVKHERIHTGEKPHVCQICGKAFRVSYCLTLHLRTHSGTRPYQCNHCGKRFKSHSVYNHHLLTHSDVRAYKCPYCPKAFKTGVQLAGHKNSHIKPFACTECNRPFASLYAVRAHMETHKRENNLKFDCWFCGATYARAFALKDHMKSQHNEANMVGDDNVLVELETAESTSQIKNEMEAEDAEQMEAEDNA